MQSQDTGIIRFRSFVTGSDVVADVTRGIGDGHAQFERKHKRTQRKYTQSLHCQTSHDRPQHLFLGRLRTGLFRRVRILRQIRVCRRIQIRVGSRVIAIARQIVFLCERFPCFCARPRLLASCSACFGSHSRNLICRSHSCPAKKARYLTVVENVSGLNELSNTDWAVRTGGRCHADQTG